MCDSWDSCDSSKFAMQSQSKILYLYIYIYKYIDIKVFWGHSIVPKLTVTTVPLSQILVNYLSFPGLDKKTFI